MKKTFCKQCNKLFEQRRWSGKQTKFCSVSCSSTWQKKNLTKPLNLSGKKMCSFCNQEKEYSEFNSKGYGKATHAYCKKCLYLYQMRRWNKRKIEAIKNLGGKCMECGSVEHPVNFDFHHRDPKNKKYEWSIMRRFSMKRIEEELKKCDLLCVKCHRLKSMDPHLWPFD